MKRLRSNKILFTTRYSCSVNYTVLIISCLFMLPNLRINNITIFYKLHIYVQFNKDNRKRLYKHLKDLIFRKFENSKTRRCVLIFHRSKLDHF